ncbi:MAG: Na/Pi cotransporter family protein [Eubacterium sp.]|nr:Na/Pi cotransporter family protein [Eubacterium sp.]
MDLFGILNFIGGLSLFLFGMHVMGASLEKRAGGKLRSILEKMTTSKLSGFITGCSVTAVIQSSSATTVMVVGFVNSGLMSLRQAINVIMGSNVGTTVTGWILSLSGISGDNPVIRLLRPDSFVPVVAAVGVILLMGYSDKKKNETGMILLGFATLMFGMSMMSEAVSVLADDPGFRNLFIMFENPLIGLLAGAVLTAIIQSSSASVGILQALAATGQITYGAAIPIIMGDSIGTCVTAILSSIGAKRDAKRAAMAHLAFNVIGAAVWITVFCIVKWTISPVLLTMPASLLGIAIANTAFKVLSTAVLLPASDKLEILVRKMVPDSSDKETTPEIDERLLATPEVAVARCKKVALDMAELSISAFNKSIRSFSEYSNELAAEIRREEEKTDRLQDVLDSYMVKLSERDLRASDSERVTEIMKVIGDYERVADHAINILESCEEMRDKDVDFSDTYKYEFHVISGAVSEVLDLSEKAFRNDDIEIADKVEPLEDVVDTLKDELRTRHILRVKERNVPVEVSFIWTDILTDLERVSDHASNVAACVIDQSEHTLKTHEMLRDRKKKDDDFDTMFQWYAHKYNA